MGTSFGYSRVFTLGNFSAITGKSKSKKTYLATLLLTASVKNTYYDTVFEASLPGGRTGVLLFDTEQSNYDAYITAKRIYDLLGYSDDRFGAFDLREYTPIERCKIIERTLEKMHNDISFVVIDGIADLAMAINDEIEASRVVSLLMKWTKKYNIHIVNIIHQNKNDEYATGHLGSAILKKSECIISVKKDMSDTSQSEVKCDLIRGAGDFDDFAFQIDEHGLPHVIDNYTSQVKLPSRI
jgi:KaiC/GvpD/RAD55 family RecA-like ATPase